jgi:hypothetical protein
MSTNLKSSKDQLSRGIEGTAADTATPASNIAAVVTYAAPGTSYRNCISGVAWSYSAAPAGGNLSVTDGSTVIFTMGITAAGAGVVYFDPPRLSSVNAALVITLAAGGSGVFGTLSVTGHWNES